MPRRLLIALLALATVAAGTAASWAYLSTGTTAGSAGRADAGTINPPTAVVASADFLDVTIDWEPATLGSAGAVDGYRVSRGSVTVCDSVGDTPPATICQDDGAPAGTHTYTVSAVYKGWTKDATSNQVEAVHPDNTGPAVTLAQSAGQVDPTNDPAISFSVHFSEPVSDFTQADITRAGSANPAADNLTLTGSGESYTITVDDTPALADGTVVLSIAAGAAHDAAGNSNTASTGDNTVTLDATDPAVTVTAARAANPSGWYTAPVGFRASGTDAGGTGIASCQPDVTYAGADGSGLTVSRTCTDNAGNVGTGTSSAFKFDATVPSMSLAMNDPAAGTRGGGLLGSQVFFNNCLSGGFRFAATVTDATSGAASSSFPALSGVNRWTHAADLITTPAGGPFASTDYAWSPGNCSSQVAGTPGDHTVTVADAAGNTASQTVTFTADNTAPTTTTQLVNGGGAAGLGTIAAGDSAEVAYSDAMDATSFCSTWSNAVATQTLSGASISVSTADVLSIQSAPGCTFGFGSIALGGNYNPSTTSAITFAGSSIAWNPSTKKLTITLGTRTGTPGVVATNGSPVYSRSATQQERNLARLSVANNGHTATASRF